jgi:hypothetical protein
MNPTPHIMTQEMPLLIKQGITSVKMYMTYESLKLRDSPLLGILMSARSLWFTVTVHAEDSDITYLIIDRLKAAVYTDPYFHAISRPQIAENKATYRIISLAELTDAPIHTFHMSLETVLKLVWKAQPRMLPIQAETYFQYLFLMSRTLRGSQQENLVARDFKWDFHHTQLWLIKPHQPMTMLKTRNRGRQTVLQGLQLLPTQYRVRDKIMIDIQSCWGGKRVQVKSSKISATDEFRSRKDVRVGRHERKHCPKMWCWFAHLESGRTT